MWEPQGMYSKFLLQQPVILFGENAIMGLKSYPASRVAVIHGSSLKEDNKSKILKSLSAFEISFVEKNNLFYGEYFRTWDIGFINNKDYIVLKGRSKELINVGGKKVSPIEIENKIKELDSELESVCIGINDPQDVLGEVVKAFVVKGSSICDFEQIDDFLKKNLEKHKVPVKYEWINEVPKTSSGKIQRQKLK